MNAIAARDLSKKYGDLTAVDKLCLSVDKGELFALLGLNGAGKTTTIKMLSCLIRPTDGDAVLLGDSVKDNTRAVKQKVNVSPQETAVAPNLTVMENMALMAGIYGKDAKTAKLSALELASRFGLDKILGKKAKTLSGGMQRRLSRASIAG